MGHLFAAGGETVEGDGVRELYVGTLSHVGTDAFPEVLDYVALGHLHVAQLVGKKEHIRYSGSPIPMGFGEAKQKKIVILLEFDGGNLKMTDIEVPVFQRLEKLGGDLDYICKEIDKLKKEDESIWLEIDYSGKDVEIDLRDKIEKAVEGSKLEVRRIKNRSVFERVIKSSHKDETLEDLTPLDVFERCLDSFEVEDEDKDELRSAYMEIVSSINEKDKNAL